MSRVKILGALACLLVAAIAAAVTGLVSPRPASASTGCCVALSDVVQSSSALFVTTSEGAVVDHAYRLTVNDVLKGTPAPALTYRAVPGEPAMPRGSRWIIVIYPADPDALRTGVLNGRWDQAWAVAANGRISLPALVVAPTTLPAFLASFGLPATDTATRTERSGPPTDAFLVVASAAAALALLLPRRYGLA